MPGRWRPNTCTRTNAIDQCDFDYEFTGDENTESYAMSAVHSKCQGHQHVADADLVNYVWQEMKNKGDVLRALIEEFPAIEGTNEIGDKYIKDWLFSFSYDSERKLEVKLDTLLNLEQAQSKIASKNFSFPVTVTQ